MTENTSGAGGGDKFATRLCRSTRPPPEFPDGAARPARAQIRDLCPSEMWKAPGSPDASRRPPSGTRGAIGSRAGRASGPQFRGASDAHQHPDDRSGDVPANPASACVPSFTQLQTLRSVAVYQAVHARDNVRRWGNLADVWKLGSKVARATNSARSRPPAKLEAD